MTFKANSLLNVSTVISYLLVATVLLILFIYLFLYHQFNVLNVLQESVLGEEEK